MSGTIAALFPVFAVILIGHGLYRLRFVEPGFWSAAERITFYVFFPALLVSNTAKAHLAGLPAGSMAAALLGGIALVVALAVAGRQRLTADGPAFTSLIQSAIRPNVYVAIAAAVALFATEGLTLISVCIAIVVPAVNIISVFVLVRHGGSPGVDKPGGATPWRTVAVRIATNPLILACALGFALNISGLGLPPLIGPLLDILGRAALPVGLLAVGAGLDFAALRRAGLGVAAASTLKLIVLPLFTWGIARALGLAAPTLAAVVIMAAVPVSASAYVMARQMGGDAPLMAGAITATTLAAAATMPLLLLLVG